MAIEYFGKTDITADFYGDTSGYWNVTDVLTCPGSGNMNLTSLGIYAKKGAGTAAYVRAALYDAAGNFIAQGSAKILISSTSATWIEHTAFTNIGGGGISPVLVGGNNYVLRFSRISAEVTINYAFGAANSWRSATGDYLDSDFPATSDVSSGTTSVQYRIRAGVEAAVGGVAGPSDIYLRPGAAAPADIILRDPTLAEGPGGVALAGIIAATSTLTASLTLAVPLDGSMAAIGALTASLSLTIPLSGTLSATSVLAAELTVVPAGINLDGAISAISALTATLELGKPLAGTTAGTSILTAGLLLSLPLTGAIDGASALTAGLSLTIPLSGAVTGTGALSAELTATFGTALDGVISATSSLTATLIVEMHVYGYAHLVTPAVLFQPVNGRAILRHVLPATAEAGKMIYTEAMQAMYLQCPPVGGPAW